MQKKLLFGLALLLVFSSGMILGAYVLDRDSLCGSLSESGDNDALHDAATTETAGEDSQAATDTASPAESAWGRLWSYYTSPQGFSFRYPKEANLDGTSLSAIKVFEDPETDDVFIAPEHYLSWPENRDSDLVTLETIQEEMKSYSTAAEIPYHVAGGWRISAADVKNEAELKDFVKAEYGQGCGNIEESAMYGTSAEQGFMKLFQVKGTGMEGDCPMNFAYRILYAPNRQKAISLVLGQECTFLADLPQGKNDYLGIEQDCYDEFIADSIRFD